MHTLRTLAPLALVALSGCNVEGSGGSPDPAAQAMLDRVAIEDMVVDYYSHLGGDDAGAFDDYFTEDAVLDVNGDVATGQAEIEALYVAIGGNPTSASNGGGPFRMVLSNPVITVEGDRATASFIWTGMRNPSTGAPPVIDEQGREFDRLVKVDGRWKFAHRVVIADSGLPEGQYPNYTPRLDFGVDDLNP